MNFFQRLFLLLSLLMIVLTSSGCEALAAQFRSPSERFRQEGDRLIEEGRTAEAILSYRAAFNSDPANLAALKSLAGLYANQGRRRLALRLLQANLERYPQNTEIQSIIEEVKAGQAISPPSGQKWSVFLGQSEPVGFAAADGFVVASLEDGSVLAMDAASGALRWAVQLPNKATSAPAIDAGRVWVGAQDGSLFVLSAENGSLQWKFTSQAPVYVPPAFNLTTVFLASGDGTLYALNPADGSLKWKFSTGGALHARPTLSAGQIYFGSNDGRVYALDADLGKPFWSDGILTQGAVESQVVVDAGRVYFGSGDTRVYALDAATGGEYWHFSTPDAVFTAPLIHGSALVAASAGNALIALDKIDGKKRWEMKTKFPLNYQPVVSQNRVVFASPGSAMLTAVDLETGALAWTADTGDWLAAGPLVANGMLFLLGKDGTLLSYAP